VALKSGALRGDIGPARPAWTAAQQGSGKNDHRFGGGFRSSLFSLYGAIPGGTVGLFTDRIEAGLERALDGVSMRQRVTAKNIANSMTPGYHAQRVDFEQSLASAISSGDDPSQAAISISDSGGTPGPDGNTVVMEHEVTDLQRASLQYQAVIDAVNFKLGVLGKAVR
jgi:flagellar basal-body rod protein FlgB